MKKLLLLCVTSFALAGCSTHIADLTVISNKNVELGAVDIDKSAQVKNVSGEDKKFVFLFIPFGEPKLQEALNDALRKADGDMMIDASVYGEGWWFLVGERSIRIEGTVVKTREMK